MYPLKFENIYIEKIWGGDEFKLFRDNLPKGSIGESWDISCRTNALSVIENGEFKGKKLNEIIKTFGNDILGSELEKYTFPLLIKLINARENLSIQVHPNDEYAKLYEKDHGKNEVWYVMEASTGANVVIGTKNCTKNEFKELICKKEVSLDEMENYLNRIPVKIGDVFYIKSGLIHGIGKGVIIAEIQQSSDITYRAYDYERGRELQIEKVMEVSDFSLTGDRILGKIEIFSGYSIIDYVHSDCLDIKLYNIDTSMIDFSSRKRFHTFTCVHGEGILKYEKGCITIKVGDSLLIPASLGKYEVIGQIKLLKTSYIY